MLNVFEVAQPAGLICEFLVGRDSSREPRGAYQSHKGDKDLSNLANTCIVCVKWIHKFWDGRKFWDGGKWIRK